MKRIFCIVFFLAVASCAILFIGCGGDAINPDDVRFSHEIGTNLVRVCYGLSDPREYGTRLLRSVVSLKDIAERNRKLSIIFEVVSRVRFKGKTAAEREGAYFRLRDFTGASAHVLRENGNDWRSILELWLAEVACLKDESDICIKEHMRLMNLAKNTKDHEMVEKLLFEADEMLHCARYSATFHEQNMSIIVLWDDSVAAKYCATLPWWKKMMVVRRIKNAIGRYPDWYLDEKKKGH